MNETPNASYVVPKTRAAWSMSATVRLGVSLEPWCSTCAVAFPFETRYPAADLVEVTATIDGAAHADHAVGFREVPKESR